MSSTKVINGIGRPMTKIVKIFYNKSGQVNLEEVKAASNILDKGGVIAVPTDTIYGFAAKAADSKALEKIYRIKGRDLSKPLSICVANVDQIDEVADTGKLNRLLLPLLLPGPVTVLLKRNDELNHDLNPGIETIGIRVPDHNFILSLCHMVGPLALTSANRSGETSPLIIQDFEELWPELDCIYDNGPLRYFLPDDEDVVNTKRLGSTVVDLSTNDSYKIIREGCALNRTVNLLNRYLRKR